MVTLLRRRQLILAVSALCLLIAPNQATRLFEGRSDLDAPAVNASGWIVPLQGSETCTITARCIDSLQLPASNTFLQALAIGKGLFNYTCAGLRPDSLPEFVGQYTELYDAAALIPVLPDEEAFHSLVPMVLGYDYERMENSTMTCMGTIGTLDGRGVITLYDIATFEVSHSETVLAPESPDKNAMWSQAWSVDDTWEVYRVETYEGRPPPVCEGLPDVFEIEYAAEYWFYRVKERNM